MKRLIWTREYTKCGEPEEGENIDSNHYKHNESREKV